MTARRTLRDGRNRVADPSFRATSLGWRPRTADGLECIVSVRVPIAPLQGSIGATTISRYMTSSSFHRVSEFARSCPARRDQLRSLFG